MLIQLLGVAVMAYAIYSNSGKSGSQRVQDFKDKYLPVEADISDHITRNTPFGFVNGRVLGKQEYPNPLPLIVRNEFSYKLNETEWGYAAPLDSPAINTKGYRALIDDQFNIQEHPRLDPTRLELGKGRHRRSQYAFIDSTP